jgi:MFS superfamily sulfate permease-like transporter
MLIIWATQTYKSYPCFINCNFAVFGIVVGFGIDTKTVGDIASIQGGFHPFTYYTIQSGNLSFNFPYAVIMAGVGLIESLLTLNIIDLQKREVEGISYSSGCSKYFIRCFFWYGWLRYVGTKPY